MRRKTAQSARSMRTVQLWPRTQGAAGVSPPRQPLLRKEAYTLRPTQHSPPRMRLPRRAALVQMQPLLCTLARRNRWNQPHDLDAANSERPPNLRTHLDTEEHEIVMRQDWRGLLRNHRKTHLGNHADDGW